MESPYQHKNLKTMAQKKSSTSDYVDGLYVKDGRLINDRFPSESGIAKAARIKRAVKNDRKINESRIINPPDLAPEFVQPVPN